MTNLGLIKFMAMILLFVAIALTDPVTPDDSVFVYFLGLVLLVVSVISGFVLCVEAFPLKAMPVLLFLLFAIFHAAHSLSAHDLSDVVRGLVPLFSYFAVFFLVINMNLKSQSRLVGGIWVLAVLAALKDFVLAAQLGYALTSGDRLTYYAPSSAIPLSVLGVAIANSWIKSGVIRISVIGFLSLHVLATQSKGLLICLVLLVPIHAALIGVRRSLTLRDGLIVTMTLILLPLVAWNLSTYGFFDRFLLVGTDQDVTTFGRLYELEQATIAFLANPIFGTGTGYIFHHVHDTLGFSERRYTHNSVFYYLAVSGVVGTLLFSLSSLYPIILARAAIARESRDGLRKSISAAVCCLIVIFIYGLVSASFKLIHINILMALLQAFCIRGALIERYIEPKLTRKSVVFADSQWSPSRQL